MLVIITLLLLSAHDKLPKCYTKAKFKLIWGCHNNKYDLFVINLLTQNYFFDIF